jgi:hypothetical protein
MNDLRYAFRSLLRNPAFAVVAILTLALVIGANTAMFTIFNSVLLRPLAYRQPERLYAVQESVPKSGIVQDKLPVSAHHFLQFVRIADDPVAIVNTTALIVTNASLQLRVAQPSVRYTSSLAGGSRVLVQREVENGRSPLASITPFRRASLGGHLPTHWQVERAAAETATGFKKGKHVGWSVLTRPGVDVKQNWLRKK